MPTTLYYTDTLSALAISGRVVRVASMSRGSGVVTKTQNTDGFAATVFDTGTTPLVFAIRVNAYTSTTGTYDLNHWGLESNAMANYTAGMSLNAVTEYTNAGVGGSILVSGSWVSATEYGTAAAVRTATSGAGSSVSVAAGNWLVISPRHEPVGTGASGYTTSFSYSGTSAAANGDSYVTLPDTITEYTADASVPYSTPYPQLLAH